MTISAGHAALAPMAGTAASMARHISSFSRRIVESPDCGLLYIAIPEYI
jgi:hypothetical protein